MSSKLKAPALHFIKPCGFRRCPAFALDGREHCPVHSPESVLARATAIINNHFDLALVSRLAIGRENLADLKKLQDAILADLQETV